MFDHTLSPSRVRNSQPRRYLMCPPTYFDVAYSINPWMDPRKPVDQALALVQWERLRELYLALGHNVELIEPVIGLPDMVFAANGATVRNGRVLLSRFRYPQRVRETAAYRRWFGARAGYSVHEAQRVNEGEGDFLQSGGLMLAGTGFRTHRRSHNEAQECLGCPVISLTLVEPRFYHLDTALAVLGDTVMYYPPAFSPSSQAVLRRLFPDAILATAADAEGFGLNAVCDGRRVVLPQAATHLIDALRVRGFE